MSSIAISVSSLNEKIKAILEATFINTLVEGEVASVTYHTSGHLYFSIKDNKSTLKCVMFRSNASKLKFKIEKGERIIVDGNVGVYTPRGEYQFYASRVEPFGKGSLAIAYEQLKKRLEDKGYFDKIYKKEIPKNITKMALVTAKNSAALFDMIKIIEKRWAGVEVVIIDSLVQGQKAPVQIINALIYADKINADVIVLARGGGSVEDLSAFNDEQMADTIFNLKTPIVSAIGHEIDVVISDFVADLRAPTPSASIEMILPDKNDMLYLLDDLQIRYSQTIQRVIAHKSKELQSFTKELQRYSSSNQLTLMQNEFEALKNEYKRVMNSKITIYNSSIPQIKNSFKNSISFIISTQEQNLNLVQSSLKLVNPELKYKNGWAEISKNGKVITLKDIEKGEEFLLQDKERSINVVRI